MPLSPEALSSFGYILGGLFLVLILRRGDVEKAVENRLSKAGEKPPSSSQPLPLIAKLEGFSTDDTNPRLIMNFLERLSRDIDHEREANREQFARIWGELETLKKSKSA